MSPAMTDVGIVGGGQLGRMLALAGHELGIGCVTLDPSAGSPAAGVAPAIVGAYDDRDRLAELAGRCDVVTYEFENVPVEAARFVEELRPVFPPPAALEAAQDRLAEKELFTAVGLPVPLYAPVDSPDEPRRRPRAHRHAGGAEDTAPRATTARGRP